MKLPGKITISRMSGNGEREIRIEILDATAGIRALEARMKLAGFAEALTGLGHVTCDLNVTDHFDKLGRICERREILIKRPDGIYEKNAYVAAMRAAMAPAMAAAGLNLADWTVSDYDLQSNHHYWSGEFQRVAISRYLPREE